LALLIVGRADDRISLKYYLTLRRNNHIGFLKVVQVSEYSECKAKTRRTH